MASKHLIQNDGSHAVDLMAYDGSNPSWDIVDYDNICDAMKKASKEIGLKLNGVDSWHIDNIVDFDGTMEDAMNEYIDLRRSQGRSCIHRWFVLSKLIENGQDYLKHNQLDMVQLGSVMCGRKPYVGCQ